MKPANFSQILLASAPHDDQDAVLATALAVAWRSGARLRILDWNPQGSSSVHQLLIRWGLISSNQKPGSMTRRGLSIKHLPSRKPWSVNTLVQESRVRQSDLVVFSTLPLGHLANSQDPLGFRCFCLVSPPEQASFIDDRSGQPRLRRILASADRHSQQALALLTTSLGLERKGLQWFERPLAQVSRADLEQAAELQVDLFIVPASQELTPSLLHLLFHHAPCPVLVCPPRWLGSEGPGSG